MKLKENANTEHEDARDWFSAYGAHVSTENHGDLTHDVVEYDWLDGDDDSVVNLLLAKYASLAEDEAAALAAMARAVREAAETVGELLEDAVAAYESGDLDGVIKALDAAESTESEHGASPATDTLRAVLIDDSPITYDEAVTHAVAEAGDAYAIIGCRNFNDAASPVCIYGADGIPGGTQWQAATLGEAEEWAMAGMVGVIVVMGYYDNDAKAWTAFSERIENE